MALRVQGDFQRAGELLKRALEIDIAYYGQESVAVGLDYNNIGQLLKDAAILGRDHEPEEQLDSWAAQAEGAFLRGLEIFETLHEEPHPNTAIVLKNLGNLYNQQGHCPPARDNLERALSIARQVYPPDHPFTQETLENLSSLDC